MEHLAVQRIHSLLDALPFDRVDRKSTLAGHADDVLGHPSGLPVRPNVMTLRDHTAPAIPELHQALAAQNLSYVTQERDNLPRVAQSRI